MERVEVLIHKLAAQQTAGESAAQLLATTQALYKELVSLQPKPFAPVSGKVAVIMPSRSIFPIENSNQPVGKDLPSEAIISTNEAVTIPEQPVEEKKQEVKELESSKSEPYALRKPVIGEMAQSAPTPVPEPIEPPVPSFKKVEAPFDVVEEVPTLRQAATPQSRELHELLGGSQESLNDKLKGDKIELAHALKTEPIKDLRKGIGVNDKFLFINELFRGDEAMYERSIKTINAFHILPEAEYWINRELKVKLGWSDTKDTVQHFYAVVRRRFS
jgi:hypothetical protein